MTDAGNVLCLFVRRQLFSPLQSSNQFSFLSQSELERSNNLKGKRKEQFLIGRWLLRIATAELLPQSADKILEVDDVPSSPPRCEYLEQLGVQFSISHSNDLIAVAIGRFPIIGLDIEDCSTERKFECGATQFCNKKELDIIKATANLSEKGSLYYLYWTQKEAWLKANRIGIGDIAMGSINFISANDVPPAQPGCFAHCWRIEDYQFSLVTNHQTNVETRDVILVNNCVESAIKSPSTLEFRCARPV